MTLARGPERIALSFDPRLQGLEDNVRFRMTYEGDLKHNGGVDHIHTIRKKFHLQLKRLWEIHPMLLWRNQGTGAERHAEKLADRYERGAYRFVPLASDLCVSEYGEAPPIVSLDILFLRSGPPGGLRNTGDIDNRLNTIFDALRMPTQTQELGSYKTPEEGENPFYVLMHDDKIVGNVSIVTDTLLEPTPGQALYSTHDARIIIAVEIQTPEGHNYAP